MAKDWTHAPYSWLFQQVIYREGDSMLPPLAEAFRSSTAINLAVLESRSMGISEQLAVWICRETLLATGADAHVVDANSTATLAR